MDEVKKIKEVVRLADTESYSKGKSLVPRDLLDLYLRPTRFFTSQIALGKTPYLVLVACIVGISSSIDRIDKQLMKAEYSDRPGLSEALGYIVDSWTTFWPFVIVMGSIGAYFLWLLGGWWYNRRLKWCGAIDHDKKTGRIIYIYTSFIIALPNVFYVILQMFFYKNYRAAYGSESLLPIILLIFPFWAVVNSHKAVNAVFELNKGKARIWFLILPIIVFILAFGVLATLFAFLNTLKGV